MSWRVVIISKGAKLEYQLGYLVVRQQERQRISMSEIHTLIIESTAVAMTAALLSELVKRKIKVIVCDEKHNPIAELQSYYGSHNTSEKLREQIKWTKKRKDIVWRAIVREKIRQQRDFLSDVGKYEPAELLSSYIDEVAEGDISNREGFAAKVYFNAIFGNGFSRGGDCALNAMLNYGYSIILSAFNRNIVAKGYATQLGIFHDNMYNPFNLTSDLMEPYRVIVDRCVYQSNPDTFATEEKRKMVNMLNLEVMQNGKKHYINNAITATCNTVLSAMNEVSEEDDIETKLSFYSWIRNGDRK